MYIQPSKELWNGRIDSQTDPLSFRYHQKVETTALSAIISNAKASEKFGLLGFQCDAGVKRNKGQIGAADAPDEIRKALAKLPFPLSMETEVLDVGNIRCEGDQLEEAQAALGEGISLLLKQGVHPIILGGGHETLYGHYLGIRKYLGDAPQIGIINIDAHFDLRPYDEKTSSGTMFKQILDADPNCHYLCAGIQRHGNTKALFESANYYKVEYVLEENLSFTNIDQVFQQLSEFMEKQDCIILTLCTDVINSAYAPGVSAPSPFGLDPKMVRALLRYIVSHNKVLSFDISEVNPKVDEHNQTVSLGAQIINEVLVYFHSKK